MDLSDFPRPSVAVDVAVLTVRDDTLQVVTVESPFGTALPGTFLHQGERLRDAAARALSTKAGIDGLDFHQVGMFDDPRRDDRGWVLSMAHVAAAGIDVLPDVRLVPVESGLPTEPLAFDHSQMVALALDDLRRRYADHADPSFLLGDAFTLLELRRLYEAIFDRELPKDTFRRQVIDGLVGTGETTSAGGGRPAELYRRRADAELPRTAAALFSRAP
ncbi:NUDIX hydrolase [Actinomycetes bacterium M1A6_2h]